MTVMEAMKSTLRGLGVLSHNLVNLVDFVYLVYLVGFVNIVGLTTLTLVNSPVLFYSPWLIFTLTLVNFSLSLVDFLIYDLCVNSSFFKLKFKLPLRIAGF